ncbi:hypothetical protein E0485_15050 [Paenibacillus albiflavus]|uniref:Replicative helicase inhibitor G39P N-terminal domain-containing protein n=1 Tax=Paenibacillus albiflavus TaxID=2545760 RepID=A0A4R4E8M7_9BACL|nr:hypothetical protein [Paenibacillus albiflavus]TCZ76154.1 hypothetical protein E0485_15050 [Paenibacillus albiflavus]
MELAEVAKLFKTVKKRYPSFDASLESVNECHKYLRDFPYDVAVANVDQHIMTDKFPPTISDIRGRLGEQQDRQRSKDAAQEYFEQLDAWKASAAPPPPGLRGKIRDLLQR